MGGAAVLLPPGQEVTVVADDVKNVSLQAAGGHNGREPNIFEEILEQHLAAAEEDRQPIRRQPRASDGPKTAAQRAVELGNRVESPIIID